MMLAVAQPLGREPYAIEKIFAFVCAQPNLSPQSRADCRSVGFRGASVQPAWGPWVFAGVLLASIGLGTYYAVTDR